MRIQKHSCFIILSLLFTSLILFSCSRPVTDSSGFINCQNGINPTPIKQDFRFPGDLLFSKRDTSEILAFSGATHELASIYRPPSDGFYDVSPLSRDGKTLVISYQNPSDKETLSITILSNRGIVETKSIRFPVWMGNQEKPNSWFPVDWANKEYLLGVLYDKQNTEDNIWETWLLNPYQLEWKSLSSINDTLNPVEQSGFSISPNLTKVLYVNQQYQLVFYDLAHHKILWQYSNYDGINPVITSPVLADATWSEDGSLLAMPISNSANQDQPGILVLDQNGKLLHLMDFGMRQFGLGWSKDKHYISFYGNQYTELTTASEMRSVIRVMDMKNGSVRDLCMLSENTEPWGDIIWSPDQKFLAYTVQDTNAKREELIIQKLNDPQLQILHLYDGSQNFEFLGWSKEHWDKARP